MSIERQDFSFLSPEDQKLIQDTINIDYQQSVPPVPSSLQPHQYQDTYGRENSKDFDIDYLTDLANQLEISMPSMSSFDISTPSPPTLTYLPQKSSQISTFNIYTPLSQNEQPAPPPQQQFFQEWDRFETTKPLPSQNKSNAFSFPVYNHTQIMSIVDRIRDWKTFGLPSALLEPRENSAFCPITTSNNAIISNNNNNGIQVSRIIGRGDNGTVYQISNPRDSVPFGWQTNAVPLILKQSNRSITIPIIPGFLYYRENENRQDIETFFQSVALGDERNITETISQFPSLVSANPKSIEACFQSSNVVSSFGQSTLPLIQKREGYYETQFPLYVCIVEHETEILTSALASNMFTDGETPHTVLQLRAFTCLKSKRLNIISERLGLDQYPEMNSMEFLPQILQSRFHDVYQNDNVWKDFPHLSLDQFPPDTGTQFIVPFNNPQQSLSHNNNYRLHDPTDRYKTTANNYNHVWHNRYHSNGDSSGGAGSIFENHSPFDSIISFSSKQQQQQQNYYDSKHHLTSRQYKNGLYNKQELSPPPHYHLNGNSDDTILGADANTNTYHYTDENIALSSLPQTTHRNNESKRDEVLTETYNTQWRQYNTAMKNTILTRSGRGRIREYSTYLLIQTLHALATLQEKYQIENLDVRMPNILLKCVGDYNNTATPSSSSSTFNAQHMPYFRDYKDISSRSIDFIEYRFRVVKLDAQGEPIVYSASFYVPNIDLFVKISDFGMGGAYQVSVESRTIENTNVNHQGYGFTSTSLLQQQQQQQLPTTQIMSLSRSPGFLVLLQRAHQLVLLYQEQNINYREMMIQYPERLTTKVYLENYNGYEDVERFMQDHITQQFPNISLCERQELLYILSNAENYSFILERYERLKQNEASTGIVWSVPDTLVYNSEPQSTEFETSAYFFNKGYDLDLFLWAFNTSLSKWLQGPTLSSPSDFDPIYTNDERQRGMAHIDPSDEVDERFENMQTYNRGLPSLWLMNRLGLYRSNGARLRPHIDTISECGPLEALNILFKLATTDSNDERIRGSQNNAIVREELRLLTQRPMGIPKDRIMTVECNTFKTININAFC